MRPLSLPPLPSDPERRTASPWRARSGTALIVVLAVLLVLLAPVPSYAVTTSSSWLWGGGFTNVVTKGAGQALYVGADVAGVHLSVDNGDSWEARNHGFDQAYQMSIASLATNVGTLYAAYGVATDDQGDIATSTDGG
jgi:hypothetical protein